METAFTFIVIVIIVVLLWYFNRTSENYGPCNVCDDGAIDLSKNAVINPFYYPYSGYWNPDSNNAQEYLSRFKQRSLPDHDVLTN